MTRHRILQAIFGITGLASAISIAAGFLLGAGDPAPLPPPKPVPVSALQTVKPFQLKPLKSYAVISERPVFSPTRRPLKAPVLATGGAGRSLAHEIVLTGVVIAADRKLALMKARGANEEARLKEGETIQGWQVDKIFPDRVLLSADGRTAVIPIWDAAKARALNRQASKRDKKTSADKSVPRKRSARKTRENAKN